MEPKIYVIDSRMLEPYFDHLGELMADVVEKTLSEPRSGKLNAPPDTVRRLVGSYLRNPFVFSVMTEMMYKDGTTLLHSINVMALTIGYCLSAGYSEEEARRYGLAGLLHDSGKIVVPDDILKHPGSLTPEEFSVIEQHPLDGNTILSTYEFEPDVITGCLDHHERPDGSGYPNGIREVPDSARIIGTFDKYEALTAERPYREAMLPEDALAIMREEADAGKMDHGIFNDFVNCSGMSRFL